MDFKKLYTLLIEADETVAPPAPAPTDVPPPTDGQVPSEGDDSTTNEPVPDNYGVEPAPVATGTGEHAGNLSSQIEKLEQFADALNNPKGDSLQKFVNDIDVAGSLFAGISRDTSTDIIKIAEQVRSLIEVLNGYLINSSKRSRDLASGAGNQPAPRR
jgi:ABC-type transporter Mla subunit MlaD